MHWPTRRAQADGGADAGATGEGAGIPGGSSTFSAPPPSNVEPVSSRFSAPPSAATAPVPASSYEGMDFSKYASSTYESDGLRDAQIARREKGSFDGYWIQNPRARQCVSNIQLGAKMGASVGGCFGLLTGLWVAVSQRNPLVLPVSVIGGAVSFGFFLGCGMIIRCEEGPGTKECALEGWPAPPMAACCVVKPGIYGVTAPRHSSLAALLRPPRTAGMSPLVQRALGVNKVD